MNYYRVILPIILIYYFGFLGTKSPVDTCNKCMYDFCSSNYLLISCGNLQPKNENLKFSDINTNNFEKYKLYSQIYGDNMEMCFRNSRKYCIDNYCSSNCGVNKKNNKEINENIVTTPDVSKILNKSVLSEYITNIDFCFFDNLKVGEMYTKCILLPIRDKCIDKYFDEVIRKCKI